MQSHPVKRVVSGALAAASVITLITLSQPVATAAPASPALQAPLSPGDAQAQYSSLRAQAEKMSQDLLNAQGDLQKKQGELDQASAAADAAKAQGAQATDKEAQYRVQVDKFAGASYTSGIQLNKLSALFSGGSTQDFLERASAIDVLAAEKDTAMGDLSGAVKQAADATKKATDAENAATAARDAAQKLTNDIKTKQDSLNAQIQQLKDTYKFLSPAQKAAQKDTGDADPNLPAPTAAAATALAAAKSKLGSPYDWGATGPSEFDCSGLMLWAYKQAGITLPRTSSAQSTVGKAVPRDQLQPGDLLFFYSPVSHVGMYVGNGLMIHAPDTNEVVKIAPIQSQYAGARRPTA